MLSNNIINLLINKIKIPNLSNLLNGKIEKLEIEYEYKSYLKYSSEELNFNNCHFIFINKDIAYLLNDKNKLYKFYKTIDNKNIYSIIEINDNIINSENISLISLEKEYLFGFNTTEFGKGEKVIELIKKENSTLPQKNRIQFDEISEKILTKSIVNSNEIIKDIYLKLVKFEHNEQEQFLKAFSPNLDDTNSLIAITQKNSSLFILHPIYKKQTDKNNQPIKNTQIKDY